MQSSQNQYASGIVMQAGRMNMQTVMFMQVVRTGVSCDFATQDGSKLSHAHFWAFYVTMATPIAIPLML